MSDDDAKQMAWVCHIQGQSYASLTVHLTAMAADADLIKFGRWLWDQENPNVPISDEKAWDFLFNSETADTAEFSVTVGMVKVGEGIRLPDSPEEDREVMSTPVK
jgi:hypothetical protein